MSVQTSYNGHDSECLCTKCMMADMDAHLAETMGVDYVDTLNNDPSAKYRDTSVRTRYATPGTRTGRGTVRTVSARQVAFIKRLFAERDTRNLVRLPGSENIESMSLRGARDLIDRLLACPMAANQPATPMATEKQIAFATSLAARKGVFGEDYASMTRKEISAKIDSMLKMADPVAPAPTKAEVAEIAGLYELEGNVYRMKKARTGSHFYAERLIDAETGAWEYAQGYARKVPSQGRKLTLEECEELSIKLGACCMCSRTLTATVDGVGLAA